MDGSTGSGKVQEVRDLLKVLEFILKRQSKENEKDQSFPAEGALAILQHCQNLLAPKQQEETKIIETDAGFMLKAEGCSDILRSSSDVVEFPAKNGKHRIPLPL